MNIKREQARARMKSLTVLGLGQIIFVSKNLLVDVFHILDIAKNITPTDAGGTNNEMSHRQYSRGRSSEKRKMAISPLMIMHEYLLVFSHAGLLTDSSTYTSASGASPSLSKFIINPR